MKATELRIGNILRTGGSTVEGQSPRYFAVTAEDLVVISEGGSKSLPVELNMDMMLRLGFVSPVKNQYWRQWRLVNGWHIGEWVATEQVAGFEETGVFYYGEHYTDVRYVHQLQNLYYALTGLELTFEE